MRQDPSLREELAPKLSGASGLEQWFSVAPEPAAGKLPKKTNADYPTPPGLPGGGSRGQQSSVCLQVCQVILMPLKF